VKLQVAREAEDELTAAIDWYHERDPALAMELLVEVDRTLQAIAEHPFTGPVWRGDRPYRKKVLTRFPYAIFFRVEGESVIVDAIAHVRRRPGYWLERAPR
jgi:plasmid stabilization system protein ParE